MPDAYSVLGITPGADDEAIKKAYRAKCKQYHPDLHPNDPTCEEKFKEVQAAYSEIMRQKNGGGPAGSSRAGGGYASYGGYSGYNRQRSSQSQGQQYQDPFGFGGFGFGPFGFGFGGFGADEDAGYSAYGRTNSRETPEMQAAANYIRNGYYREALNVLDGIPDSQRTARWHYYCALANSGLGNNVRAQSEARMAADLEPNNYEYQNLLERLQNPGSAYTTSQRQYQQPGRTGGVFRFCITLWMWQMFCSLFSFCCNGGRGGFYFC